MARGAHDVVFCHVPMSYLQTKLLGQLAGECIDNAPESDTMVQAARGEQDT
jgi:hypothetical protein